MKYNAHAKITKIKNVQLINLLQNKHFCDYQPGLKM